MKVKYYTVKWQISLTPAPCEPPKIPQYHSLASFGSLTRISKEKVKMADYFESSLNWKMPAGGAGSVTKYIWCLSR